MKRQVAFLTMAVILMFSFGCAATHGNLKKKENSSIDVFWQGQPKRPYTVVDEIDVEGAGTWAGVRWMVGNKPDKSEKTARVQEAVNKLGGDACIRVTQQYDSIHCTVIKYK